MLCKKCGEKIPFWRKRLNGMHVKCIKIDNLDMRIKSLKKTMSEYQKEYREMFKGEGLEIKIVKAHGREGIKMWSPELMRGVIVFAPRHYQTIKKCAIELGWEALK